MGDEQGAAGLEVFLAERGDALLRTAALLAASRPGGEDLLQEALERLLRHWHVIDGDPEPYLRRTLYNLAVDGWRRRARQPEVLGLPVAASVPGHADGIDQRLSLIQAMRGLPPRERAVLVARYWEELSEAEAAAALGCSVSAVKSATSRGLRRLREAAAAQDDSAGAPGAAGPAAARARAVGPGLAEAVPADTVPADAAQDDLAAPAVQPGGEHGGAAGRAIMRVAPLSQAGALASSALRLRQEAQA